MKVLLATTNPSKVRYYAGCLLEKGYEVVTLNDLKLNIDVVENGHNPIDNAIIKAKEYYKYANIPTIAVDDGLFIDGLIDERQPGNEVRRVNGKRLDDNEMVEYYTSIVKELGHRVNAKWIKGVAIYNGKDLKTFQCAVNRVFVSKPSSIIPEGYPLDGITYWDDFKKYTSELTKEEMNMIRDNSHFEMIEFIKDNVLVE